MSYVANRASDPMSIKSVLNDRDVSEHRMNRPNLRLPQMPLPPIFTTDRRDSSVSVYQPNTPLGPPTPYSTASTSPEWYSHRVPGPAPSSRRTSTARAPRPKYSDDQGYFIWYHRTDLAEPWDKVLQEFERQFHHARPKGGLQCKFYRLLDDWRVEKVRAQARSTQNGARGDRVGKYGLVQRTNLRFSWMRPEHYTAPVLPQFSGINSHLTSPGASPCPGCDQCSIGG